MNRSYLILLFAAALFVVLVSWGIYSRWTEAPPAAVTQPTTQPLVERLRAERERRMRERGGSTDDPSITTRPATAPAGR